MAEMPSIIGDKPVALQTYSRSADGPNNSHNIAAIAKNDIIISLARSEYTHEVHPQLREHQWQGLWLDASSALRNDDTACLALPPLNRTHIAESLINGIRDYTGPNCTTSLLSLGLQPLLQNQKILSMDVSTYQSLSGAGQQALTHYQDEANQHQDNTKDPIEYMDSFFNSKMDLLGQVTPWIDTQAPQGMTREEQKMQLEIQKLTQSTVKLNAVCIRIPTLCTHAQTAFVTLAQNMDLTTLRENLQGDYNHIIPNNESDSITQLRPRSVFATDKVHIGRIRLLAPNKFACYVIGDQLRWGAALPITSTLEMMVNHLMKVAA